MNPPFSQTEEFEINQSDPEIGIEFAHVELSRSGCQMLGQSKYVFPRSASSIFLHFELSLLS